MTLTIAIIGLGPVGQCALISLLDMLTTIAEKSSHTSAAKTPLLCHVIAIDDVESRRLKSEAILRACGLLGSSEALNVTFSSIADAPHVVKSQSQGGLGCNAVLEVVGSNDALLLGYDLLRPFGVISSVGVHTAPQFPLTGDALYSKNVSLSFGRCPVRSVYPPAMRILHKYAAVFGTVGGDVGFVERIVSIDDAPTAYTKFHTREWGKVLFDPWTTDPM
eukprot:TRINITY_DN10888_c0_g1_i1.p1 TRINITY_DN10888_c0_g1~~TRINITY_DN10888_c0_g1_i1.p1  ORF type:complete len:220 (-),score=21.12 TRINITY_DN10888_c0_g1_i1:54-713(-)